ncbi:DUF2827 domain-containing protein [Noviherbaspirillum galbum]|uniref:DUF2827 domain-containing protein n=1 Tax=Noviherbaspirillum galbum TaxID=2709383 RepID=A0A6B3SQS6_9BURK|nr:DUF2827 domain-containing protein [Noviherbaspirillum galbum]NEX61665.1 DUF2827 domain-containing protein [Noviherbaspirillum galbum]
MRNTFRRRPENLRVGVSIVVRKGDQSLWENGIFQNCLYLVMLLMRSPRVAQAYLVAAGGDGDPQDAHAFAEDAPVPIIDLRQAGETLDVMIEMSAQLPAEWINDFRRQGGKIIAAHVGNDYVIDVERMNFDKAPGMLVNGAPYHEIWTLPQHLKTCAPYYQAAFRAPVRVMPHLWSPVVLNRAVARLPADQQFGYQPGRKHWRLAMFEPNICMVKTSFIPMLCCDVAHRMRPDFIEHVWVYNTFHLRTHPSFVMFANSLDITKHGLASFEGRFPLYQVMAQNVDAVVSHHWENGQNYLYYEALHGGYPLIHNSEFIADCGYYYPGFDCELGGLAILRALAEHDAALDDYRRRAHKLLAGLDPGNEENVRAYTEAILRLYEREESTVARQAGY